MAVITFLSDFGMDDHYVAAVKGKIMGMNPDQQVIDISHTVNPFDISHGAFLLKSVFRDFPEGTVHLVSVDGLREKSSGIALELQGHFFVGFDCGLFSMISDVRPEKMVEVDLGGSVFPAKDVLAAVAVGLAGNKKMESLGNELSQMKELFARQVKVTKREIAGNVMNVDHFGNLITNITKFDFEKILEINGGSVRYQIRFGREAFGSLHRYYTDVESGDCYVMFNSNGLLQIGINKGNASQLLGLGTDAPVHIEFSN
ncbi:MAG: SAM-dependent chlorinase/fluorinase [Cyclobacteriaceae bacterium]